MNKTLTAIAATVALGLSAQASAYDLKDMQWEQVVEQAKKEKAINVYVWYFQPRFRTIFKEFEDKYGIKVRVPNSNEKGNINKLIAEGKRSTGKIDVMAIDAARMPALMQNNLVYGPITDVLPDADKLKTKLNGVETGGYAVSFWGNQTGFAYDPSRVNETELPQSFAALSEWISANPYGFGVNDPNKGGAGNAFIQRSITNMTGDNPAYYESGFDASNTTKWSDVWTWFDKHSDEITITSSNADSLTRMNDGEISLAPAWEDHLKGLQAQGAITPRIKFYIPEFGMPGGGNMIMMPANTSKKAASMLFINWITSAEVQTRFNEVFGSAPQHPDADDSKALVSQDQRQFSTQFFTSDYATKAKKAFTENVLM